MAGNPYGGNYSQFSQALGDNLQQDEDNRIRQEKLAMEKERQAQDMAFRQEQILDMKVKQNEKLIVPSDSGVKPLDAYLTTASRGLVDQAAALRDGLKNGSVDHDQFASQMAQIQTQVPQLQSFKTTFTENMANYTDALAAGTLSSAQAPGTDAMYKALASGGGDFDLVPDPETGEMTMMGLSADGNEVKIPISGIGQMPKPLVKQPAPWETLKPSMQALAVGQTEWDEQGQEQANIAFDQVMAGGKGSMMSMAVDWFGIPYDEAEELYMAAQDPDADDATKLAETLRGKWQETAETQFRGARVDNEKRELDNQYKKAQIENYNKQISEGGKSLTANQALQQEQQNKVSQFVDQTIAGAFSEDGKVDVGKLQALTDGKIQEISHLPAQEGKEGWSPGVFGDAWGAKDAVPEEFEVYLKGEDQPRIVGRNELGQIIKQLKLGNKAF